MQILQRLSEEGDSEELVRLGTELFRNGEEQKAFEYYRAACKLGNATAMGNLGFCYQSGRGVKADLRMAAYCFERASELDDAGSMLKLGDFFYHGKGGIPKDRPRAYGYYLRAYEIETASSEPNFRQISSLCYRLGICKKDGQGTEPNFERAYEYLQEAAEAVSEYAEYDDPTAENLLERIQTAMNECEIHF